MRGFVLDKTNDEYLKNNLFKGLSKEVCKEEKFDNISIINPINSNSIYIINNICVQSDNEEFFLGIGQGVNECSDDKNSNLLFIQDNKDKNECLYVINIRKKENLQVDLLEKKCVILLPKGCLNIKFDKPVNHVKIEIHWKEENIH